MYRRLGRIDAAFGARSWTEALAWLGQLGSIREIQYWGHGRWGKESVMGNGSTTEMRAEIERYNYDYGHQMAKAGFVTGNAGPFERDEWESEIAGEQPDLSLARGTALEPLANGNLERRLRPLFETRVRRTKYRLADDGRAIALTIDRGKIAQSGAIGGAARSGRLSPRKNLGAVDLDHPTGRRADARSRAVHAGGCPSDPHLSHHHQYRAPADRQWSCSRCKT